MIAWPIEVLGAYSPNVMENRDSANFALTELSEVVRRKVSNFTHLRDAPGADIC
jgi:hypothetical protein